MGSMSKSKQASKRHEVHREMAMFAALGDKFVCGILKQIAADYSLDYKELKSRYTGPTSLELYEPAKSKKSKVPEVHEEEEMDLADDPPTSAPVSPVAKAPKAKKSKPKEKPKEKAVVKAKEAVPGVPMALSKMKKQDLLDELSGLGIDTDSKMTVVVLKGMVKDARAGQGVQVKGGRKSKVVKQVPEHTHEPLMEEAVADCGLCDSHGDIASGGTQVLEPEEFEVANQSDLQARLARILAEADEDEEDECDGDETEGEEMDELEEE